MEQALHTEVRKAEIDKLRADIEATAKELTAKGYAGLSIQTKPQFERPSRAMLSV